MELVKTEAKKYVDYLEIINTDTKAQLDYFVNKMQGKKIAMVNATSYGGGVAEILHSMVPLGRDMGLDIDWWVIKGANEFYNVTKAFHNRLQGEEGTLSPEDKKIYLRYNELNADTVEMWDYDFIIIHDPQPAALIEYLAPKTKENAKWVWRCHIDTSTPNPEYWSFLYNYIKRYEACIFTMEGFVQEKEKLRNLTFITPSIDPLSTKNTEMELDEAKQIIARYGVDIHRPFVTQISRFDPWKDPLGVIDTYKIVKKEYPSVQLALVGSMASDDPEGWDYLYRTLRRAGEDYDIKVVTNFNGVSNREVNAFQTASDVVLQKSLREGFGLTVSEALWKGTPVVGGNVGGIKYQIIDGVTGYLVDTVEECADKVLRILRNPTLAQEMKEAGKERVRKHFLITTHLLNYLKLLDKLEE